MIQTLHVQHIRHTTSRSFDAVIGAFETAVGTLEEVGWPSIPAAATDVPDFERRVKQHLGPSGFTRFLTIDHGEWMTMLGHPAQFRMYTIGNPLIAITMLRQDLEAGLNVPVRVAIYRVDATDETRFVYDLPSSLMSGTQTAESRDAALKLDAKLEALAKEVTGTI